MKKFIIFSIYSALLLLLSFKPFGYGFFGFIALVPYFYILSIQKHDTNKNLFYKNFLFGVIFSLPPNALIFYNHTLILLIMALIYGLIYGVFGIIYTKLKKNNLSDVFIFASLWVIFEWIRQIILRDFDYTTLAYTSYFFPMLLSFASIGGIYFVSYIIALANSFIAYVCIHGYETKTIKLIVGTVICFAVIYFVNISYLQDGNHNGHEISFSSIQVYKDSQVYSGRKNEVLTLNSQVKSLIKEAVENKTDYIIYPYNFVGLVIAFGDVSINKAYINATSGDIDKMLKKEIPQETKFIYWTDSLKKVKSEKIFDETEFWVNGTTTNYYQKRSIHPFYDVASGYFLKSQIMHKPYEYEASQEDKLVEVGNEKFSNLNCSELNYSSLERHDSARGANIILSVGYSSVFEYALLGQTNIVLSQLRAAENNLPLVRSDIRGPSVFVNKNGAIVSENEINNKNVLMAKLFVEDLPQKTFYTRFGDWPIMILLFIILFVIIKIRKNV